MKYEFIEKLKLLPFVNGIYLFGSRATGEQRPRSDIDIAILCPNASEQQWLEILDIVENSDTLLKVDCVRYDTLQNNQLKIQIDKEKQVLYER